MIKIYTLLFIFFFSSPQYGNFSISQASTLTLKMKIIGVKDGDTLEGLYYQMPITIRLEHVDAPEKKQAFGSVSKQKLSELTFGKIVIVRSAGAKGNFDRNGRLIAEISLENGLNVNKEMVKSGLAWHYKKYSANIEYAELEAIARKNRTGLWADKDVTAPWNFRKR